MRVGIILGTRPEIIKMAPVIRELQKRQADFFVLHTGQHYTYGLDGVFFDQLQLPRPKYNLETGSGTHAESTAKMLVGIEKVLQDEKPDWVLVEGDTNTVLAGALAAAKLGIKIGHVEAGLRSRDRSMPEEINRILTDHCSDRLFAPTQESRLNLLQEGIDDQAISVTGNTVVDAIRQNLEVAQKSNRVLGELGLRHKKYILATVHRQENVDVAERFSSILDALDRAATEFRMPVIYPMHPRAREQMKRLGLQPRKTKLIDPVDYLGFLALEGSARLVLTDSGGVQEETCMLGVPCVTLRDNTERPETVRISANVLAGTSPDHILACCRTMLKRGNGWKNPFGDGHAAEKIINVIMGA